MGDPDDSFDEDEDLVLAFIEQEQQTIANTPLPASQAREPTHERHVLAKRERKRSRSVSPSFDGPSVRNMKPKVESPTAVSVNHRSAFLRGLLTGQCCRSRTRNSPRPPRLFWTYLQQKRNTSLM